MCRLRVLITFAALAALVWATLSAVLFAMWWSAIVGVAAICAVVGFAKRLTVIGVLALLTPLVLVQLAIPEFSSELDEISCATRAAMGEPLPHCDDELDRSQTGPVLSGRQHLAVRWLNLNMASGGYVLGFREVAWETLMLDDLSTEEYRAAVQAKTLRARRGLCRAGAEVDAPTLTRVSDFAMDSKMTRAAAAKLAAKTRDGQERWEQVRYRTSSPAHVWLALLVPDTRIHARREGDKLHMWYRGGIHYPNTVILTQRVPRLFGRSTRLTIDEAMFCGLQMDGVFRPYNVEWHWTMSPDDQRLTAVIDEHRFPESVLR